MSATTIPVNRTVKDQIDALKIIKDETFNSVMQRLIDRYHITGGYGQEVEWKKKELELKRQEEGVQ